MTDDKGKPKFKSKGLQGQKQKNRRQKTKG